MKNKLLTIAVVGLLAGPMTAQAQQYEFEILAEANNLFGINDSGDAVGNGAAGPLGYSLTDGSFTGIAPAAGYDVTAVTGINDAGVMVGSVFSIADGNVRRGMIRSKSGAYTVFMHPDTTTATEARGVNNKGLVSGYYRNATAQFAGFIYDSKTGNYTNIILPNATRVFPHGINSIGEVVGDARFSVNPCVGSAPGFGFYGWLREKHGSVILFTVNGMRTQARGINDAGMVVGQTLDPTTTQPRGFVIKAPETNCESVAVEASALLDVPGYTGEFPEGINNSGDLVGIVNDSSRTYGVIARQP